MSHTVQVRATKFTDRQALAAAVARIPGATIIGEQKHYLFQDSHYGLGIALPGWTMPVIVKEDGTLVYDNYNGQWGDQTVLDELMQGYMVEKAKAEALAIGGVVEEYTEENGDVVLRISTST